MLEDGGIPTGLTVKQGPAAPVISPETLASINTPSPVLSSFQDSCVFPKCYDYLIFGLPPAANTTDQQPRTSFIALGGHIDVHWQGQ